MMKIPLINIELQENIFANENFFIRRFFEPLDRYKLKKIIPKCTLLINYNCL